MEHSTGIFLLTCIVGVVGPLSLFWLVVPPILDWLVQRQYEPRSFKLHEVHGAQTIRIFTAGGEWVWSTRASMGEGAQFRVWYGSGGALSARVSRYLEREAAVFAAYPHPGRDVASL